MEIPTAKCDTCKQIVPVLILETDLGSIVGCVICKTILSKENDIKVEYYDANDLHKVSKWKFTETGV